MQLEPTSQAQPFTTLGHLEVLQSERDLLLFALMDNFTDAVTAAARAARCEAANSNAGSSFSSSLSCVLCVVVACVT